MPRRNVSQAFRDRTKTVCQALRQRGRMSVAEIQALLGVSDMTVRRCLNDMAAEGLLRRVHGGAVAVDASPANLAFNARTVENLEYKTALAREAVKYIPSGCSIYLDGGTTCYEISRHLPADLKCFVVTDSIAVLKELRGRPGIETILLGGQLAADDNTVDGPMAAENAAKMSVDLCMISVGSFTTRHLQNNVLTSMLTKRIMLENAKRNICVSDAGKFNKSKFMRICEWDAISLFLTDDRLPQQARDAIAARGVEVRVIGL